MIYYILLVVAAILFASQFMVQKGYEKSKGKSLKSALVLIICEGLSAGIIFFIVNGFKFEINGYALIIAIIIGAITAICTATGIKVMGMGSIQVYTLFLMLGGLILPFLYGVIFLKEDISIFKVIGLILLLISIFLPLFIKNEKNVSTEKTSKKTKVLFYILCTLLFLTNGINTILCKVHQLSEYAISTSMFTSLYFFSASIFGLIILIIVLIYEKIKNIDDKSTNNAILHPTSLLFGFIYALVNGTGCFLNTFAAKEVNAVAQYPIVTGGTMVFSAILASVIYKEKLNKLQIAQLVISLVATILFMF